MPLRRTRNSKRRSKRQSGSGFTFGLETPIGGLAQVNAYSDCGSVNVPQPMDHSVGNVVPGCAANGAEAQPASNAVQVALNSGVQAGGKRKKHSKKNKNKKQKKNSGKKSKAKGKAKKSKSKAGSKKRSKKSRK